MEEGTCLRGGWAFSDVLGLSLPFLWSSPVHSTLDWNEHGLGPWGLTPNLRLCLRPAQPGPSTALGCRPSGVQSSVWEG